MHEVLMVTAVLAFDMMLTTTSVLCRPHEDDESQPSSHYNNNEPCGQHYPQTDSTDDDDGEDEVGDDEEPQDSPGPFGRNSDKWNYRWDFETGEWMHPQGWSSSEEDEDDCDSQGGNELLNRHCN